jgi:SOS response regulatory protein OraA/RecX
MARHDSDGQPRTCVAQALRHLQRRALSRQALARRLAADGHTPTDIEAAIAQVVAWGYVNDHRLAESTLAAAERRRRGPAWLSQRLRQEGVPAAVAEASVQKARESAPQGALALLQGRFDAAELADARIAQRALRLLQRRGFAPGTCFAALQAARAASPGARAEATSGTRGTQTILGDDPAAWADAFSE